MRNQPANEKGATRGGDIGSGFGQVRTARVGVNQRQGRCRFLDPGGMTPRQIGSRLLCRPRRCGSRHPATLR